MGTFDLFSVHVDFYSLRDLGYLLTVLNKWTFVHLFKILKGTYVIFYVLVLSPNSDPHTFVRYLWALVGTCELFWARVGSCEFLCASVCFCVLL